jgi:hypothetical protein
MMIRKQIYLAPEQEAKLKRIARVTGRTEAEIIREALDALPETSDPILAALLSQGMIEPPPASPSTSSGQALNQAQAEAIYQEYLERIGRRKLGLSQTVLQERLDQK